MVENPLAAQSRKIHASTGARAARCGGWMECVVIGHRENEMVSGELGGDDEAC